MVQGLFPSKMPTDLGKAAEVFRSQIVDVVQQVLFNRYFEVSSVLLSKFSWLFVRIKCQMLCLLSGIATLQARRRFQISNS